MQRYIGLFLLIGMFSCKTKSVVVTPVVTVDTTNVATAKMIAQYYTKITPKFNSISIKSNVKYADERMSQNVNAEIRILKDQKIMVLVRVLGITMAKAYITPDKVQYYEKIGGKYFDGNFEVLSRWLGTDLDFQKIQKLLIGEALDTLNSQTGNVKSDMGFYKIETDSNQGVQKQFYIDSNDLLLKKELIFQSEKDRMLQILYPTFATHEKAFLPENVLIEASQGTSKTNIEMEYKSVTFDEELTFPYQVPNGYEPIIISKTE
ncbi:hypothetical protein B0A58_12710 [Flavobacterium branchiophilum NBRC 15030 = ATCC 35035]|uniref:Uncharacterized protein DUF4292 n=1 Tax=Flavobacterium branchiophilum TaxID=55197 RepID=A0A543G2Z0_9FLAO|nr:DUF4292 domain-containing protein [Flavobacterium branchiophilum]OXA72319.1 hypothetical protein B0A58_12710 [Flavobacterium branchiophilum NBRC 15030 = ATCC 35035]TQM40451.1 uncharacterized protein DUF4292 [Flavobacterium branchiophilum]GEM55596.1 hypothetical protein FB1_18170 [Flavobacterium branchiophilum NBRC 15030 = ATCC 35035]